MCKMKLLLFSVFFFQKGISIFGSLCSRLDLFQFFLKQCAIVIVTKSACHTFIIIVLKCLPIVNFVQQRQEHMMMGNPGGGAVQMYAGNAYTMNAVSDACDQSKCFVLEANWLRTGVIYVEVIYVGAAHSFIHCAILHSLYTLICLDKVLAVWCSGRLWC